MKIAIPVWNERVAPVFDNSHHWILFELKGTEKSVIGTMEFQNSDVESKVDELINMQIKHMVCGAISRRIEYMLVNNGCDVTPFIAGEIKEIIHEFSPDKKFKSKYRMPGCSRRGKKFCRRSGRR